MSMPLPLSVDDLRWRCDPASLGFETTAELEPVAGIIGQASAGEALEFGLATNAPGHNVYVRGLAGTGRITLVRSLMERIKPACPIAQDRCYVRNFEQPDRPRLISVPRGAGIRFRRLVDEMVDFIRDDLGTALKGDILSGERRTLEEQVQTRLKAISDPFEKDIEAAGLALVSLEAGPVRQPRLVPVVDGKPVPAEALGSLVASGELEEAEATRLRASLEELGARLDDMTASVDALQEEFQTSGRALVDSHVRALLAPFVRRVIGAFRTPEVSLFLEEMVEDAATRGIHADDDDVDRTDLYRVNVVVHHAPGEGCPIVSETSPTLANLLGTIDLEMSPGGGVRSDHTRIHAGALLRADGGFLLLEARELLTEPGAWRVLVRTLRTGRLEIVPPETNGPWVAPTLKPEPVEINVKVVLVGDAQTYAVLDDIDADFPNLFKVLVDFDNSIERSPESARLYAGVLARIARDEGLPAFDAGAVAALVEHGARIASDGGRLTARFGRVADLAREAAYVAGKSGNLVVCGADVHHAVTRTKQRADLPARRYRKLIHKGTIQVELSGHTVGQINGLAVVHAGPLTYGFPQRITATVGPGGGGVIAIDSEAELSGAIHNKGFYILAGLMRTLLKADHPLAFEASIAFEQSYGGIDGDSASGAEIVCLLSALTGIPIRQDLSMTGAIDQTGHLMAIGGANEKIEGFFDACSMLGPTATPGVIIPKTNVPNLMLRRDVTEACAAGRFAVYACATIDEAITLLLETPCGCADDTPDGPAPGTVLAVARARARAYWDSARRIVSAGRTSK